MLTCSDVVSDVAKVHVLVQIGVLPPLQLFDALLDVLGRRGHRGFSSMSHGSLGNCEGEVRADSIGQIQRLQSPDLLKIS